ncbi:hypothetical protein [Fibrobacter sp.]|uniref:hypothetical protein n=1 Tax=Fibrobacter sp. TaxID=35828 RepID=UPI00388EFD10
MVYKFNGVSKFVLLCLFFLATLSFAEDLIATASNGATVILHDNGRWEYYQNNSKIRDIRPDAIPEDAKYNISVVYESCDKLKKDVRMAMEADFATEEEIKDSLRKVPKGGVVYFQVPTTQIKKGFVRELNYSIYDKGKKPIFSKTSADTEATLSEDHGVSNLMVVPIYAKPKAKVLKARITSAKGNQTLDFEIPVK